MSTQDAPVTKKITKKQVRKTVYNKLATALLEFKKDMKDKQFERNLQKASKLFAQDISKSVKLNGQKNKKKKITPAQPAN